MGPLCHITIHSHFFKVSRLHPRVIEVLLRFCAKFAIYSMVTANKPAEYKVYGTRTMDGSEYRFTRGQYRELMADFNKHHITPDLYTVSDEEIPTPLPIELEMRPDWSLRDYQEDVVKFIVSDEIGDFNSRLVSLPTGYGKTLCALAAVSKIKQRTVIFLLASYIDRWVKDMPKILDLKPKDIAVVQGSAQLISVINKGLSDELQAKFIIVSITTYGNYIKDYEAHPRELTELGYNCNPDQFFKTVSAGAVIIDETHQHLHAVYKILTYTNVRKVIALSATLVSENPTVVRIHHSMYPKEIRYDSISIEQYIKTYAFGYQFRDIRSANIRTSERGSNSYSHNAFEVSVMRNRQACENYIKMIVDVVNISYIDDYRVGDKMAIYVTRVDMIERVTAKLKTVYPKLDIRRYAEDDPYENLMDPDIRVTTLGSAGTAHDIPGLRVVLLTISVKSMQSNIQVLGRLRKLPDRDVKFYYLFCEQIRKHVQYHHDKVELFRDRVEFVKELKYPSGL